MADDTTGSTTGTEPKTFEELMAMLSKEHRTLVEDHIGALSRALDRLKEDKKTLKSELDDALKNKSTDADAKLTAIQGKLQEAEQRSGFYENAVKQGIKNPRLAWIAARDGNLVNDDGTFDKDKVKESYPELFEAGDGSKTTTDKGTAKTNAGSGNTGSGDVPKKSFDEAIREAAGVEA